MLLLANRFIEDYRESCGSKATGISSEVAAAFRGYRWPGNIRELQNVVQRALILCEGQTLEIKDLPPVFRRPQANPGVREVPKAAKAFAGRSLENLERHAIENAILEHRGNVSEAMRALNIGRNRFYARIRKYNLAAFIEDVRKGSLRES